MVWNGPTSETGWVQTRHKKLQFFRAEKDNSLNLLKLINLFSICFKFSNFVACNFLWFKIHLTVDCTSHWFSIRNARNLILNTKSSDCRLVFIEILAKYFPLAIGARFGNLGQESLNLHQLWCCNRKSPSGMCAELRTVAASNNIDHARNFSYYCLLVLHM